MKVGVLALQGDVREHEAMLERAGATPVAVRRRDELASVDALIIPGGESTTIGKLLRRSGLLDPLRKRVEKGMPAFGTCAGAILLARDVVGPQAAPDRVGLVDITVARNAYGRQIDSFECDLDVRGLEQPLRAVFIRAPTIERVGEAVDVLATHEGRPVLVRQGNLFASTFHPEIAGDERIHGLFLER